MRQLAIYLIFFFHFNSLYGQHFNLNGHKNEAYTSINSKHNNFDTVDAKVRSYGSNYNSPKDLAEQILKDFTSEKDRVRALYTWLCLNIRYDMASFNSGQTEIGFSYTSKADYNRKMRAINTNIINKTLRAKKAICEGYAQTFKRVSEYLGIPFKLIGGYAKGDVHDINNPPNEENHAWNAVKINKKWYLVDATWGAGHANGNRWVAEFNDFYFFTNPDDLKLTHYPTENEWFLTENKPSKNEFYQKPIFKKAFFTNAMKLIAPNYGVLEAAMNSDITFLMTTIPENINLYYVFKGDTYSKKIKLDCNTQQCSFNIPFTKNQDSELYIFANKSPILEFYIQKK